MKNWTRIKELYDDGFIEMYLDLYKYQGTFMIKGTSYHYNAGAENMLCEADFIERFRTMQNLFLKKWKNSI